MNIIPSGPLLSGPPPVMVVIDSHTAGEPTRVVVAGGPDLGTGSLADRRALFREKFDHYRRLAVGEPRGSEVLVGALLTPPTDPTCAAGVIFFNNVGVIGMCGHGTIGVAVTLMALGRIGTGPQSLETPVGKVRFQCEDDGWVSFANVPSYRLAANVAIPVEGVGVVHGDVAWGGNWFFFVHHDGPLMELSQVEALSDLTWRIRQGLRRAGVTGANGMEIDHIELCGPPGDPANHSRNFVLCPGRAYDRSPCGTGVSARLACLLADGQLQPGEPWRQESILGTVFVGSAVWNDDRSAVIPTVRGQAFITGETRLLGDPCDPFRWGIIA